MDFEDYKTKIQKVSNIIEHAKYPEDVLNNEELDLKNDFQYICLNSNINCDLVNAVISRIAQDGNKYIVEENIKNISVSMWKDLFNQNKFIKEIFINNFNVVIENTGIITYREIENFINDVDARKSVYENIEGIIKKLCTYDRASLIACIRTKEDGIDIIKKNLELFFKKGEYDISTTYSKILVELSDIPEISEAEILEACSKHLVAMLDRETAVDNETNVLLNWIYDSMEDAQLSPEKRADIQADIDKAIMENFDEILDKTNYSKETIKILKLFPCTHEKFESSKNMFIENSSKLIHMTKIYDLNYEKEQDQEQNNDKISNVIEQKVDKDESFIKYDNVVKENEEENFESETVVDDFSSLAERFIKEVESEIDTLEEYEELINQSEEKEVNAEEILDAIVKSNLYETDKIIDKVVNKERTIVSDDTIAFEKNTIANTTEISNEVNNADDKKVFVKIDFGEAHNNIEGIQDTQNENNTNYKSVENDVNVVNKEVENNNDTQSYNFSRSIKNDNALVISKEQKPRLYKVLRAVKGFFIKIKRIIAKHRADRIGD